MKTCYYQFEQCPNPDALVIHLTEVVPDTRESKDALQAVRGVVDAHTSTPYSVTFTKGRLFYWDDFKSDLIVAISNLLCCEMSFDNIPRPQAKQPSKEERHMDGSEWDPNFDPDSIQGSL